MARGENKDSEIGIETEKGIDEIVSDNIKKYRKAKGLTQQQLADLIGCEKNNVQRWENGVYPKPENIKSLANALDVHQSQLFLNEISLKNIHNASKLINEFLGI